MSTSVSEGVWPDGTTWQYESCASDATLPYPQAVFGLHFTDTAVLLTKNQRGWDIPGGHIEPGETPAAALRRELLEECGFTIASYTLCGLLSLSPGTGPLPHDYIVYGYVLTGSPTLLPLTANECTDAGYIKLASSRFTQVAKKELVETVRTTIHT